MGGPVANGPRSQARASSGPCPASSTTLPLEEDPRRSRGRSRNFRMTSQISGFTQDQDLGTSPRIFQISRIEFRWDFILVRDQILVRLAEASTSFPVPPEGPDSGRRVSPSSVSDPFRGARSGARHPAPLWRGRFVCGPRAPWPPAPGGVSYATPLQGCFVSGRDPSPAHAGGPCHP